MTETLHRFRNQRAIVTGAGRGIGLAVARALVGEGARVALLAQHEESAVTAAANLNADNRVIAFWGDLGCQSENYRLIGTAIEALGGVDILVNNAGWTLTSAFLTESQDYWDQVLAINLWAVIWATRQVLEHMTEPRGQSGGSIVNVASDAGRVGMQGEAVYAAAKGGVIAFTKSIAQEMARYQVRVNCVCPGPTRTRVLEDNLAEDDARGLIDRMIKRIPLRRIAEPTDIADAVLFLAGDTARNITGQVLSVSGGLTMV